MTYYVVTRQTPVCPYCVAAKRLLQTLEINYEEIEVTDVIDTIKKLGIKTVPAIFLSKPLSMDSFLGGYEQLREHLK